MITDRVLSNKIKYLKKSFLLLGPRQTGKSTLLKGFEPDFTINLADQEIYTQYLADPGLIKKKTQGKRRVFIDEVQRIPSLLNTLQSLIDANPDQQFFLSGSSARKLRRGQANLLPGRILVYELGPLTPIELGENYDEEKALERGLLPGIYWEDSREVAEKLLRSYGSTYLKEEIQAEALTRNLEGFSRFFQVLLQRSGSFLDVSKFASEASISRSTARRYFDVFVDTLLVYPLESFSKSSRTRIVQHPRFFLFDVGVLNGCLENFKSSGDRIGLLFEHLVLQSVFSAAKSVDAPIRISNFRTSFDAEVDFIVEVFGKVFALEVKSTRNVRGSVRGFESFKKFYGKPFKSIVIYRGSESYEDRGNIVCTLREALNEMGFG